MSKRIYVATRKGLFTIARNGGSGGSSWAIESTAFLGDPVSMTLPDARRDRLYAALDLGHFGVKLQRSRDGGASWEEIAVPVYPEPEPGVEDKDSWGKPLPWRLVRIWALETGGAAAPDLLWCGTLPGGLFRSPDGGASWEMVRSLWDHPKRKEWFGGGADLPGLHSICVDPRNPRQIAVGVSCGGVWRTADGAETWECRATGMWASYMPPERRDDPNIQDPHRLVQCPAAPEHFWVQHHNGIFRSTDGTVSWHEVKNVQPSSFGFAVAVHPRDPGTAWFVPGISDERRIPASGQVVVTRTRDGGNSFEVLRRGLPQQHAYDLVFRHALDIDDAGTTLAFGSTTGSLWVSEDGGDSWIAVSEHLPPIYCVRFAK